MRLQAYRPLAYTCFTPAKICFQAECSSWSFETSPVSISFWKGSHSCTYEWWYFLRFLCPLLVLYIFQCSLVDGSDCGFLLKHVSSTSSPSFSSPVGHGFPLLINSIRVTIHQKFHSSSRYLLWTPVLLSQGRNWHFIFRKEKTGTVYSMQSWSILYSFKMASINTELD